ncbi:hypothetical protein [Nocardia arthritidis]|uniref:Uncharacterized protein n=1 Tax=Nocardia arthritidis TaxID=228602 RepID=A0A6G9YTN0_9NOCA|nr:hypothetical protein [Nocardia arthritidis]QIS16477.1 hypothetical protein F5544_43355 [Nocardia arthritidis]
MRDRWEYGQISYKEFVEAMSHNELNCMTDVLIAAHMIANGRMSFFNGMDY